MSQGSYVPKQKYSLHIQGFIYNVTFLYKHQRPVHTFSVYLSIHLPTRISWRLVSIWRIALFLLSVYYSMVHCNVIDLMPIEFCLSS